MKRHWVGRMVWEDLLFMHWPVDDRILRPLIPAQLEIDRFDGQAWIGVIPFTMSDVRLRFVPSAFAMGFPELNVRTYVRHGGRPGVWFFSLDAASRLAVWSARQFFHLPYQFAAMSVSGKDTDTVEYRSRRVSAPAVQLVCRYRPAGPIAISREGTLDYWLTERYSLFSANDRGQLFRGDIEHRLWPLQPAEVEISENTMTAPIGLTLPQMKPLLHFARRLDVVAWMLHKVSSSTE